MIQQWFMESLGDECQPRDKQGRVQKGCAANYGLGLAFAMGLNLSLARVGSTINNKLSPYLADHFAKSPEVSNNTNSSVELCPMPGAPIPQAGSTGGFDDFGAMYDETAMAATAATDSKAKDSGVPMTLFFGVVICAFSLSAAILTFALADVTLIVAARGSLLTSASKTIM